MNVLSDTKERRSPVTHAGTVGAPHAGILDGDTLVVYIILRTRR